MARKKIRFCILATARTGSNWLCSALDQHPDIVCFREVFHPNSIFLAEGASWKLGIEERIWRFGRNIAPRVFLKRLEAVTGNSLSYGFKLFPEHGWSKVEMMCADPELKIILLTRRNRLAQFSSLRIAQANGRWVEDRKGAPKPGQPQQVEFEADEYQAYASQCDEIDTRIRQLLSGREFLELVYEDLEEQMVDAFRFVGFEPMEGTTNWGTTRKQNRGDLLDRFSNPEAVVKSLTELGQLKFIN